MKLKKRKKLKRRLLALTEPGVKKAGDGWTLLRAGDHEATNLEIPTVCTDFSTTAGPVRLALGESGEARVLLPLAKGEVLKGLTSAPALQMGISTFSSAGKDTKFLDLICLSKDLEPVFEEVVDEIMVRITAGEECVNATHSTIEDFRSLLTRASFSNIPTSTIAGFVGELIVLDRLLNRSPRAWHCWRGPIGDRHDFRNGNFSMEVKSTLRAGNHSVIVNGFDQLEAPTGGTLHLLHFVLEPVAAGMFNVLKLGKSILAKADDPREVKKLFASVGCADVRADSWNQLSFRLETETLYEISEGFPRLVPSILSDPSIPASISDVSYRIDLGTAVNFTKDLSQFSDIEEILTTCL